MWWHARRTTRLQRLLTSRVCPMRCARACACRSICGFQSAAEGRWQGWQGTAQRRSSLSRCYTSCSCAAPGSPLPSLVLQRPSGCQHREHIRSRRTRVVHDDRVGALQVEAHAAGADGQQEHKGAAICAHIGAVCVSGMLWQAGPAIDRPLGSTPSHAYAANARRVGPAHPPTHPPNPAHPPGSLKRRTSSPRSAAEVLPSRRSAGKPRQAR